MTLLGYLFLLFIEPLKLLFEAIFFYAYKLTANCGISIIAMSLVVNFLLLPLYFRADKLEKEQNDKKKAMEPDIKRIKAAFRGDERIMMLQAYYKEKNYKSGDVFKESVSLFLQIPFFIAAYSFLSGLNILHGMSLGPITDLGMPDGLIHAGSITINLLPILMTAINILSGFIYSEKGLIRDKIKLILIALVFLVLLYGSPSGLVFYWTLNNLFSLVKNVVVHLRRPKPEITGKKNTGNNSYRKIIILSFTVLTVLTGLMIPADVISQNPQELINTFSTDPHNPAWYLLSSFLIAAGMFLIWMPLFCYLANITNKKPAAIIICSSAIIAIVNYILFNKNFGLLTKNLTYESDMVYDIKEVLINMSAIIVIIALTVLLISKLDRILSIILTVSLIAITFLSLFNTFIIINVINSSNNYNTFDPEDVVVPLTRTGQNVIVIMMDRLQGSYMPYIFNERPDVAEQFDGFVFYPNTLSYGGCTNVAAPALYGGYEYTPYMIDSRSDELLVDKHNEALRVLPTIFSDEGWNVSVGDPSYANYEWIPDVGIYDYDDNINAFLMAGTFNDRSDLLTDEGEAFEYRLNRNLFCFGLMKTMPYLFQPFIYTSGTYYGVDSYYLGTNDITYRGTTLHTQTGIYAPYVQEYTALEALPDIIDIQEDSRNCFFMFANGTAHEITLLQEPEYLPAVNIDNTDYDAAHEDRFTVEGITMHMDSSYQNYAQYECSVAACIELGQWFDYLRDNGLYDNTRIIIVADHGYDLPQFDDLMLEDPDINVQSFNPVLMVKDFGATGFEVSNDFMTNADTPFLTLNGVIDDPVNPFTGNPITEFDKTGNHYVFISEEWNAAFNNTNQFSDEPDSFWVSFCGNDIRNADCWDYCSE